MMERLTGLSFDEICERLERNRAASVCDICHGIGDPSNCPGLMVNELGVMAVLEKNKKAEAKLRDIMDWPEKELRGFAYFYAIQIDRPDAETGSAIVAFGDRPENESIMRQVDKYIAEGVIGGQWN